MNSIIEGIMSFKTDMRNIDPEYSDKESLVQQVYDKYLSEPFGQVARRYKCDAFYEKLDLFDTAHIRLMCEYKYDLDFSNPDILARVLSQVVSYMRTFQAFDAPPSTILIGDVNEVMTCHSNWLIKFLNFPGVDWHCAASSIGKKFPALVEAIKTDPEFSKLQVLKFSQIGDFDFTKDVINRICELTANNVQKIAINENNIFRYSEYFMNKIVKDEKFKKDSKKMAAALYQTIIGEVNEVLSRGRPTTKAKPTKFVKFGNSPEKVLVDKVAFDNFIETVESEYSRETLSNLTGVFDRLIEDTQRRRDGKFYTPAHLCEAARAYADKYLGEDWRTRGIVWDNSCGTCNLTKGVYFRELYVSTLDQEELDAAELSHSIDHRFTTAFQYDFLNDPYEKLPEKLRLAIENGVELTFFCNPPYGTACAGIAKGVNKKDSNDTEVNKTIEGFKLEDLLSQFLFKMASNFPKNKVNIILFGNITWLAGQKAKKFRDYITNTLSFKGGFVCNSKEFNGNAEAWPLMMGIFTKRAKDDVICKDYTFDIFETERHLTISEPPCTTLSDYASVPSCKNDLITDYPCTSDAVTVNTANTHPRNFTYKGNLGFFTNNSNYRSKSAQEVCLWSMPYSNGHGLDIYPSNFVKCCEVFTARRLTAEYSWINEKEEYYIPNHTDAEYPSFSAVSLVFSIFDQKAKSTSVALDYKVNHFDIKNHFFWLTKLEFQKQIMGIEPLEGEPDEVPYMVTVLNEHGTVDEGWDLINQATELLKESYPYREEFAVANPILQLDRWDAGYKQLKPFWEDLSNNNDEFKAKYDKFKADFIAFKKAIKPMVWKFGFLKGEPEE